MGLRLEMRTNAYYPTAMSIDVLAQKCDDDNKKTIIDRTSLRSVISWYDQLLRQIFDRGEMVSVTLSSDDSLV